MILEGRMRELANHTGQEKWLPIYDAIKARMADKSRTLFPNVDYPCGLAYYLLPRLGFGPLPPRMAFWQPLIYGGGQLLHIAGLAWSGGYGVQRKTAGLAQGADRLGEIAAMGLMGLGGLVSIIGGLLFLVAAYLSIRSQVRH